MELGVAFQAVSYLSASVSYALLTMMGYGKSGDRSSLVCAAQVQRDYLAIVLEGKNGYGRATRILKKR